MNTFPRSPRTVQGGLVLINPDSSAVRRVIVLQYNPETLSRTLQPQSVGGDSGDRLEALRLKGAPVETIKLDAEIDAGDQLEFPDQNPVAVELGIHPQLAAIETILYPASADVQRNISLASAGTLEIAATEAPLSLFIWSKNRILPVRITEFTITEEMFDVDLNPIRAKVSLGMRVLGINDLGFAHKGSGLFMTHHRQQERFASIGSGINLGPLGIRNIP